MLLCMSSDVFIDCQMHVNTLFSLSFLSLPNKLITLSCTVGTFIGITLVIENLFHQTFQQLTAPAYH